MTRIGSLFSGYGGLDMGAQAVLGGAVAWHCEVDPAPSRALAHHWPDIPNLGDITAVDWPTVDPVDVLTGGFPCTDVSHAGKRAGLKPDTRSGLWEHMAYAVERLRPRMVVIENVRGLLSAEALPWSDPEPCHWHLGGSGDGEPVVRALGRVLADLVAVGYVGSWVGVSASDAGAPHGRFRVFIVAHPADATGDGRDEGWTEPARLERGPHAPVRSADAAPDADLAGGEARGVGTVRGERGETAGRLQPLGGGSADGANWGQYAPAIHRWERVLGRPAPAPTEPGRTGRPRLSPMFVEWMLGLEPGHVTDPAIGLTRNQQLKALGNGVVPQQAALALRLLLGLDADAAPGGPDVLLPTPSVADGTGGHATRSGARSGELLLPGVARSLALLPTPAVNDMGDGKTPPQWDEWTDRMKTRHGNGNGHGASLAIEAQRLVAE